MNPVSKHRGGDLRGGQVKTTECLDQCRLARAVLSDQPCPVAPRSAGLTPSNTVTPENDLVTPRTSSADGQDRSTRALYGRIVLVGSHGDEMSTAASPDADPATATASQVITFEVKRTWIACRRRRSGALTGRGTGSRPSSRLPERTSCPTRCCAGCVGEARRDIEHADPIRGTDARTE